MIGLKTPMQFDNIVSHKDKTITATLSRLMLLVLSYIYGCVVSIRNIFYDIGVQKTVKLSIPVICIGNLTAGGTGKTPMVIYVVKMLLEMDKRVVILSRGYKSKGDKGNDENILLGNALPGVEIVVDSDRIRGGKLAIEKYHPDIIVMDDGFQHRRLHRDLDITLIDARCPFGYGYVIPRGYLREQKKGLRRSDVTVITRADQVNDETLKSISKSVAQLSDNALLLTAMHAPNALYNSQNNTIALTTLKERPVYVFCAIARGDAFVDTLKALDCNVVGHKFFQDHHHYSEDEIALIVNNGKAYSKKVNNWYVTTEKDWVKIALYSPSVLNDVYWLRIETKLNDPTGQLKERLKHL